MSISRIEVSAYLDRELSPTEIDRIHRSIKRDDDLARDARTLAEPSDVLHRDRDRTTESEIRDAQFRVRARLERSVRSVRVRRVWWESEVRVPVPIVVSASVAFLIMTTMFVLQSNRNEVPNAGALAVSDNTVNLQVNVAEDQTDALLQWLNEQEGFTNVTIELPAQAEFQMRSAPVLLRQDKEGEQFLLVPPTHTSDRTDQFEIVPLGD